MAVTTIRVERFGLDGSKPLTEQAEYSLVVAVGEDANTGSFVRSKVLDQVAIERGFKLDGPGWWRCESWWSELVAADPADMIKDGVAAATSPFYAGPIGLSLKHGVRLVTRTEYDTAVALWEADQAKQVAALTAEFEAANPPRPLFDRVAVEKALASARTEAARNKILLDVIARLG